MLIPAALFLVACSCLGVDSLFRSAEDNVNIRVCSISERDVSHAEMGSGRQNGMTHGTNFSFSGKDGETECSRYKAVEPVWANYSFLQVHFDSGERFANVRMHDALSAIGADKDIPLEVGSYYTFEITFIQAGAEPSWADGEALRVIKDDPPN